MPEYGWAISNAVKRATIEVVTMTFLSSMEWQCFVLLLNFGDTMITMGGVGLLALGTILSNKIQALIEYHPRRMVLYTRVLSLLTWIAITATDNNYARMAFGFLVGFFRIDSYCISACLVANVDGDENNIHGTSMLLSIMQIAPSLLVNMAGRSMGRPVDYAAGMIPLSLAQIILACVWPIADVSHNIDDVDEDEEEEDERRQPVDIGTFMVWCALILDIGTSMPSTALSKESGLPIYSQAATTGLNLALLVVAVLVFMLLDFIGESDCVKIIPPAICATGALVVADMVWSLFDTPQVLTAQRVLYGFFAGATVLFSVTSFYLQWARQCVREREVWRAATMNNTWQCAVVGFCLYTRAVDPVSSLWHFIWLGMVLAAREHDQFPHAKYTWAVISQNQFQITKHPAANEMDSEETMGDSLPPLS
jgi:hypothetical protein